METMTFTNSKGQSVVLGNDAPFVLVKTEGTGEVRTDIQSQKSPQQDGVSYLDNTLEPRVLSAEIMILGNGINEIARYRKKLTQVFNPKLGPGQLTYQLGDVERKIEAISELSPVFPNAGDFKDCMQPGLIQLYCPNPYWEDISVNDIEIVSWIGGLTFPLVLPTQFAMAGENKINIINTGHVETPVKIEIHGPATNPKIENTLTGEFIRVNRFVEAGKTLIVTTDFGNKRVEIDGVSVFHYIDLETTFFSLCVGDNVIEITTEDVNDNAKIRIEYRNRYVGV